MKFLFSIFVLFIAFNLNAQFIGPDNSGDSTVKDIIEKPTDDIYITVRGHITKKIGFEKYLFSDGSGEIRIDIDEDDFPKEPVTPYTLLEINGDVERKYVTSPEIDVKWVRIISEKEIINKKIDKEKQKEFNRK